MFSGHLQTYHLKQDIININSQQITRRLTDIHETSHDWDSLPKSYKYKCDLIYFMYFRQFRLLEEISYKQVSLLEPKKLDRNILTTVNASTLTFSSFILGFSARRGTSVQFISVANNTFVTYVLQ